MQGTCNDDFDKDVLDTKEKFKKIEQDWIALNPKNNRALAIKLSSGEKFYKWKMFDNDICQRVSDHGKTEKIDCISYITSSADAGRMFFYCKTCGWYLTWYYYG